MGWSRGAAESGSRSGKTTQQVAGEAESEKTGMGGVDRWRPQRQRATGYIWTSQGTSEQEKHLHKYLQHRLKDINYAGSSATAEAANATHPARSWNSQEGFLEEETRKQERER